MCCVCLFINNKQAKAQAIAYLESIERNTEPNAGLLVTPDGKYIIKSYYKKIEFRQYMLSILIFDTKSFRMVKSFSMRGNNIPVRLTENGKNLIFASNISGPITYQYLDLLSGQLVREITPGIQNWAKDILHDSTFLFSKLQIESGETKLVTGKVFKNQVPENGWNTKFCNRGKNLLTIEGGKVYLWDLTTNAPVDMFDCGPALVNIKVAPNSTNFAVCSKDRRAKTYYFSICDGKIKFVSSFNSAFKDICFGLDYIFLVEESCIKKFRVRDGEELFSLQTKDYIKSFMSINTYTPAFDMQLVEKLPGTEYLLVTDVQGLTHIFSTRTNKVMAYLYTWEDKDFAMVTPDGRMDGTRAAIDHLHWVGSYNDVPLANTYDQMYTPGLMGQLFSNMLATNTVNLQDLVKYTPGIKITVPAPNFITSNPILDITCELKDNGDEIRQVRIYINDKLVNDETRGMKSVGNMMSFHVNLLPGINSVKAVAITKNGYQSAPAEVQVSYSGTVAEAKLFVMAVGIDKYKNSLYNLNYAVADASAVIEKIKSVSGDIFQSIHPFYFSDERAVRDSVISGFNKIASESKPQDAFLFFYAGHGVMSEGNPDNLKDFYLVLHDVTQLYGKDDLLKSKGISAVELQELSKKVPAQKQIILLDACQSGAAVESFALRGAAEEKAILQLARSTGSYLIASTGSDQYATEFKELGHGVFTYALLEGLSCKKPGVTAGNKVTVKELEAFLNDYIPELSEKYHGTAQYPKSWSKGMDFPLSVCK